MRRMRRKMETAARRMRSWRNVPHLMPERDASGKIIIRPYGRG
jgi:hypothetical protein